MEVSPASNVIALQKGTATAVAKQIKKLPYNFAKRHGVLTHDAMDGVATLIAMRTVQPVIVAEAQRYLGCSIILKLVEETEFKHYLARAYDTDSSETMQMVEGLGDELDLISLVDAVPVTEDLMEQEDDAPIIRLINALLTEAAKQNASDIHIETFEHRLVVRFRVDGVLREVVEPKRALAPLLVSRIKVMAKLDIAEKRIPQDGRISLRVAGREIDVRV